MAKLGRLATDPSTRGAHYTERLVTLGGRRWKRVLGVQAPYRRNVRRLFGEREVLEVGCGIGRNLAHLAPRAVGVDHNADSIAVCRARGLVAFTSDEFPASEYAGDARFDGLLAAHLIEHMTAEEAIATLRPYLRHLRAAARVVLICPQERGFASDATHVQFADLDALARVGAALGVSERRRTSFPFPRAAGRVFTHNEFVWVGELALSGRP